MKIHTKFLLSCLFLIIFKGFVLGQELRLEVFPADKFLISKSIIQSRDLNKYFDGGAFRCGFFGSESECNYEKIRRVIWQCWNEKTRCYLTINSSSVDASKTEHIFIEPNKNNKWLVVRRNEAYHALIKTRKPINDLPKIYSVEWQMKDEEKILVFKNRFGKKIDEF